MLSPFSLIVWELIGLKAHVESGIRTDSGESIMYDP